jgi:hypothetical protein
MVDIAIAVLVSIAEQHHHLARALLSELDVAVRNLSDARFISVMYREKFLFR